MHVFGLSEKARVPKGNPCRPKDNNFTQKNSQVWKQGPNHCTTMLVSSDLMSMPRHLLNSDFFCSRASYFTSPMLFYCFTILRLPMILQRHSVLLWKSLSLQEPGRMWWDHRQVPLELCQHCPIKSTNRFGMYSFIALSFHKTFLHGLTHTGGPKIYFSRYKSNQAWRNKAEMWP